MQMGINCVGPFALSKELMPLLKATAEDGTDVRVVTVSSIMGTKGGRFPFEQNFDSKGEGGKRRFKDGMGAYADTKLGNQLFTLKLHRLLQEKGYPKSLRAVMAHPGYTATNLQNDTAFKKFNWTAQSAANGALPSLRAASDPAVESGSY